MIEWKLYNELNEIYNIRNLQIKKLDICMKFLISKTKIKICTIN